MSERTTHNIIASTNAGMNALALEVPAAVYDDIMARWREAADRLAELDAKVVDEDQRKRFYQACHEVKIRELAAIHDKLPPCPTCGGKGYHVHCNGCGATWADRDDDYSCSCVCAIGDRNHEAWVQCPCPAKCVDGKVSIEQLVATYNEIERLWAEGNRDATVYHLRSVKP